MTSEPETLRERGRDLEREFFRREDAPLGERVQQVARRESAREAMARASGIRSRVSGVEMDFIRRLESVSPPDK